ncbi:MAG: hypothetical protein ALAOOOJD_04703 [bacterium]|nr:hypothetical protein [bacterium]
MKNVSLTKSNTRPVLNLPRSSFENSLEFLGAMGLLLMFIVIAQYWPSLPERIPSHFGVSGQPDAWSGKSMLLILPVIAAVLYAGLTVLSRYPHLYNYAWPITEANAAAQYRLAREMIIVLKTEIVWLFAYVNWQTIQTALGRAQGLGPAFLPIFLLIIFGSLGFYLYKGFRAR